MGICISPGPSYETTIKHKRNRDIRNTANKLRNDNRRENLSYRQTKRLVKERLGQKTNLSIKERNSNTRKSLKQMSRNQILTQY